ncbi:hypothetical protein [Streptomyces sp. NPDC050504]|uniref:hypothetical protein n=1 Tax=Streptomyces sp. NPDC050504 TaxID=3365618 RepID=UPI0037B91331
MSKNTRRGALAAAFALAAAVAVGGCGADEPAAPKGWGTLEAGSVRVSYPEGWKVLEQKDRGRTDAAAVLVKNGTEVAKIAVQLKFMKAGDAGTAAAGAMASLQPGGKIKGNEQFKIGGDREAERVDYTYSAGAGPDEQPGGVPDGTLVTGADVVTMDADDEPVLVRINTTGSALSEQDVDKVVESVDVR